MQKASKKYSETLAKAMILKLAGMSQWFEFEPYPDDQYLITVKAENKHLLVGQPDIEVVEKIATYDDNNGCFTDNVPMLDAHVVVSDEHVVVDLAKPNVPWKEGPRLFLNRYMDHWRCFVHTDGDDAVGHVSINDDGTVGFKKY